MTLSFDSVIAQEKGGRPFGIEALRPIQMSRSDVLDRLYAGRRAFSSTSLWTDFLLRSIGLEPSAFDERAKRVALLRMVPFVERNYNLVELGPRGTGKSHLFQQISPYAHLISGGKATVARMFVNMATGQRGLVCQYDVVCFDEVAGVSFDSKDGVNIMKGYMASGEFSRGRIRSAPKAAWYSLATSTSTWSRRSASAICSRHFHRKCATTRHLWIACTPMRRDGTTRSSTPDTI